MKIRKIIFVSLLSISLVSTGSSALGAAQAASAAVMRSVLADSYLRTELFFGRSKPDGSMVSDEEWGKFLNEIVMPRFPDGFTVLDGIGQYRDKSGTITVERSKVLVILYASKNRKDSRAKIEEIRKAYVKMFNQESVMRMDLPGSVRVTF